MTFENKRIIITGASSGIGEELARQLAVQGAKVALAARREAELKRVAEACRKLGGEALAIATDVTDLNQCQNLVEETVSAWGGLDMLVLNAGISMWTKFEDITDPAIFEKLMQVNYLGAVNCTFYALPHLKKSQGKIVVVSSLTGKTGVPTRTGYSASKHALHGFFDSLRVELMDSGVQITIACPGFIETDLAYFKYDGNFHAETPRTAGAKAMSVQECAEITLKAAASGKREVVMTAAGKLGVYLRPFFPGLIDKIARKKVAEAREHEI